MSKPATTARARQFRARATTEHHLHVWIPRRDWAAIVAAAEDDQRTIANYVSHAAVAASRAARAVAQ